MANWTALVIETNVADGVISVLCKVQRGNGKLYSDAHMFNFLASEAKGKGQPLDVAVRNMLREQLRDLRKSDEKEQSAQDNADAAEIGKLKDSTLEG